MLKLNDSSYVFLQQLANYASCLEISTTLELIEVCNVYSQNASSQRLHVNIYSCTPFHGSFHFPAGQVMNARCFKWLFACLAFFLFTVCNNFRVNRDFSSALMYVWRDLVRLMTSQIGNDVTSRFPNHGFLLVFNTFRVIVYRSQVSCIFCQ